MSSRKTVRSINLVVFIASVAIIGVFVTYFFSLDGLRAKIDATKTRAYSLSAQTTTLLDELDESWVIALILVEDEISAAERKQIDEVLRRYTAASPHISVMRVDPTDPETLDEYESVLGRLRLIYNDEIQQYDSALDAGASAFDQLRLFAQQQASRLNVVAAGVPQGDPLRGELQRLFAPLALLPDRADGVMKQIRAAREINDGQPIPDYEVARSILAAYLEQYGDLTFEIARLFERIAASGDMPSALRGFAQENAPDYDKTATDLAAAADPLKHLPDLELALIGRQIKTGETAVVIGPDRAAVIPREQLLPRVTSRGGLAFDRRFRGEQLISATIRSLRVDAMPMVVFVHGEGRSLLRQRERNIDLLGVGTTLSTARFDVREWDVGTETERPNPDENQRVVWVIVPPTNRQTLEPSEAERELIDTTKALIADGESILLSVHPSLLPRYNQPDPWKGVADPFAINLDTSVVLHERFELSEDQSSTERGVKLQEFLGAHSICSALHGQQSYFALSVPVRPIESDDSAVRHDVIAEVEPNRGRWLESQWQVADPQSLEGPTRDTRLVDPMPLIVAARRANPVLNGAQQRAIVVGSGGWMLSYIADDVENIGGGRVALTNPGNQELMLASVAWLAGMDELIAPSPISQQVSRLAGVTGVVWLKWFLIAAVGMPLVCLFIGGGVWFVRRI